MRKLRCRRRRRADNNLLVTVVRLPSAVLVSLAVTLVAQTQRPKTFADESNAWFKTHPPPPENSSPQQQRAFDQQVADASAQWVRDWPDDPRAWLRRFKSLARLKSTPDHELEEIGDTVLKVAAEHPPGGFRFVPFQTDVAEVWSERHLRSEQCLQLTQDAVRIVEQAERENPSAARQFMPAVAQGLFRALTLQMFLAIEVKKFEIAESAVDRMRRYLDTHPGHPEDRPRLEHWYLANAAVLADSEGRKPDALLYYSEAFREYPEDSSTETHAHQLWKELGGSDEGFDAWTSAVARTDRTPPGANQGGSAWTPMNKPLTAFHGADTNHKIWTLEDLKGKSTLVNIWATWCRPCQDELPAVQAIFDQLKDRKEMQVLTVSVDEDFSWVARFAERQRYTFPIIAMSSAEVDKMVGMEGVPRTWIVDATGTVRFEMIGYDRALWPKQVLRQLDAVK
jgi:peroxiredoxin